MLKWVLGFLLARSDRSVHRRDPCRPMTLLNFSWWLRSNRLLKLERTLSICLWDESCWEFSSGQRRWAVRQTCRRSNRTWRSGVNRWRYRCSPSRGTITIRIAEQTSVFRMRLHHVIFSKKRAGWHGAPPRWRWCVAAYRWCGAAWANRFWPCECHAPLKARYHRIGCFL